ncbi:hypothetical protein PRIPAC_80428 [Pristionchus pacificus]|uniref:Defective in cullin neddylation protein n=1 Tax=Pristionchus pacificus TaxID=54126 RepID=A0A2A6BWU8_PRIPA|nr:hypothetical protein PRIPAC_80428 [Pristionchus pacificus]|eukprot:PDM70316.1 dcn-1 [Pristionchus pacificus]
MPGPSSSAERSAVKSFCDMMHTTEEVAISCLSPVGYDVEEAIDNYYQSRNTTLGGTHWHDKLFEHEHLFGDQHQQRCDETSVRNLFERYANDPLDSQPDRIGPHGVARLLRDLSLDAEDRRVLVLASKMEAQVMCEFSLPEWLKGMQTLNTIFRFTKNAIISVQPVYQFAFGYGKKAGHRNLDLDIALVYWRILFQDQFPLLSLWEEFMTAQGKPVTRDTWNLLGEFAATFSEDLSDYDEDGAWPVVLDKFVTWARPRVSEMGSNYKNI